MQEKDLYPPVVAGLLKDGFRVFKIADGSIGKKPFDITGIDGQDGRGIGLELKATNSHPEALGVNWSLFQQHQIVWLRTFASSGAIALAAIYDKQAKVIRVWLMKHANDKCQRECDTVISRDADQIFTGWRKVFHNDIDQI